MNTTEAVETHPCQKGDAPSRIPKAMALRAYEVYCHVYAPRKALITGGSGFGAGELIALLYARAFPVKEWRMRVNEYYQGAKR